MSKIGKVFKAVTIGGLLGFVAGLLFAPKKGEETRQQLQEALEKGKEKLNEIKEELADKE